MKAHDAAEVETILAALRGAGCKPEDLEIGRADLEDVFLDIMQGRRMNGWRTLLYKEVLRFWKVSFQTVAAPVLTAVLYLLIFGHVLEDHVKVYDRIGYTSFLIPGLVMMSVLQNAFANSSSAHPEQDHRQPRLPAGDAAVALGLVRRLRGRLDGARPGGGAGVLLVTVWFAPLHVAEPWWIVAFAVLGAAMLGSLGLIAGLWAEKFDQMAGFQNFIIMPMTFPPACSIRCIRCRLLAGGEPPEPFFYMIDGFRHGFFGVSDVSPWISLGVVATAFVLVAGALALQLLRTGYKAAPLESRAHGRADSRRSAALHCAGLACEHLTVEGDGRHFFATIVSAEFGAPAASAPPAGLPGPGR